MITVSIPVNRPAMVYTVAMTTTFTPINKPLTVTIAMATKCTPVCCRRHDTRAAVRRCWCQCPRSSACRCIGWSQHRLTHLSCGARVAVLRTCGDIASAWTWHRPWGCQSPTLRRNPSEEPGLTPELADKQNIHQVLNICPFPLLFTIQGIQNHPSR